MYKNTASEKEMATKSQVQIKGIVNTQFKELPSQQNGWPCKEKQKQNGRNSVALHKICHWFVCAHHIWMIPSFVPTCRREREEEGKKNDSKGYHPEMKAWISAQVVTVYRVPDCPFHLEELSSVYCFCFLIKLGNKGKNDTPKWPPTRLRLGLDPITMPTSAWSRQSRSPIVSPI